MSDEVEYRCFVGGLSWSTSDRDLKDAFEKFGHLLEAKVAVDKFSGRSRGFGFVTFDEKKTMEEAIEAMHGMDLDGRTITVEKAQPHQGSGRDHDSDRSRDRDRDRDRGRDRDRSRDYGGMEIDLGDVVGILVVVGEVTDIVVTVLDHMTAGVQEVSDLDEMTA
ncbi:hypothetical protein ACSBR1_019209 [Camellia fascicularis]